MPKDNKPFPDRGVASGIIASLAEAQAEDPGEAIHILITALAGTCIIHKKPEATIDKFADDLRRALVCEMTNMQQIKDCLPAGLLEEMEPGGAHAVYIAVPGNDTRH